MMKESNPNVLMEEPMQYGARLPRGAGAVTIAFPENYQGPNLFRNPSAAQQKIESEFPQLFPTMAAGLVDFLIDARGRSAAVGVRRFWHALNFLKYAFGYSTEDFCEAIGLSKSSWDRKLFQEAVAKPVYDRVFVLARLYAIAHDVLDEVDDVRLWFGHPLPALGGTKPQVLAIGEPGTGEVLNLLEAMREGTYS